MGKQIIFGIAFMLLIGSIGFASAQSTKPVQDIVYTAKFVCGSISDNFGPLRPGHYDTSINILNIKGYRVGFVWSAVVNDGPTSNSIFKNLDSETSTGMSCQDIKDILGIDNNDLLEGFVVIKVPVSSLKGFDNEQVIPEVTSDAANILEVHLFYSANALDTLPHEIAEDKISFYIIQDGTGKIPKESFRKLLDVTMPSTLNQITDTEGKVKAALAKKYDLSNKDLDKIVLRIKNISIGVGSLLDDHAVSLHVVKPMISK
ncbi:MAG: hypothetical protein EB150_04900 [Nitrososphaeria archaeon]|nr:hypothetical protein [Nitrososphaeria archaeon]NDB51483.1 hypothetical protein [Nitrosopumilaceae archaeon]NDB87935.1 hypothetical protein [Nitrososphaerota archaeon]NDB46386.1 hypothetical protein [Nitrososphaeria archaeon]NDB62883.1 hypothetical protein [Nitrosopumilaceae archaeon]